MALGRLASMLVLGGCAIVTTKGAPDHVAPHAPPTCTKSKAAVYADGVIAAAATGTSLFLGLAAIAKEGDLAEGETNKLAYATLFTFLGGVGFSVSGVVGGFRVRSCRKAHATWRAMQPPAVPPGATPYPYPPPQQPPPR